MYVYILIFILIKINLKFEATNTGFLLIKLCKIFLVEYKIDDNTWEEICPRMCYINTLQPFAFLLHRIYEYNLILHIKV